MLPPGLCVLIFRVAAAAAIHRWVSSAFGEFLGIALFTFIVWMAIDLMMQPD